MRLTKNEKHRHNAIKFVRRYAFFPRKVQSQWIVFEHYYVGYQWTCKNDKLAERIIADSVEAFAAKEGYRTAYERRNMGYLQSPEVYPIASHEWTEFKQMPERLSDDAAVAQYLIENSPLAKALTED